LASSSTTWRICGSRWRTQGIALRDSQPEGERGNDISIPIQMIDRFSVDLSHTLSFGVNLLADQFLINIAEYNTSITTKNARDSTCKRRYGNMAISDHVIKLISFLSVPLL